tara:strand:+ start:755 stop:937 length:183 start_codon:yes stop_codon:yes gene_type:complete
LLKINYKSILTSPFSFIYCTFKRLSRGGGLIEELLENKRLSKGGGLVEGVLGGEIEGDLG